MTAQNAKPTTAAQSFSQCPLIDARRSIALGRWDELSRQSARLAGLVGVGKLAKADAVDALHDAALANDLIEIHGVDAVHHVIARAFGAST